MASERLNIVLDAVWRGAGAIDKATKQLKQAGQAAKDNSVGFENLAADAAKVGLAFTALGFAAKQGYEFVKSGAALEKARSEFDNLSKSIGTTSDAMLTQLSEATAGMMSNAEMISSASQIISLGLAQDEEGVVRLAKSVSTLGLDMNQVILTFANNSKMRLDALGISIQDVDRYTQELNATGFDGDAFDEAVLLALEDKMELLGDASLTTAGKMEMIEAEMKNVADSAKLAATNIAGPLITAMTKGIDEQQELEMALARGVISHEDYAAAVRSGGQAGTLWKTLLEEAREENEKFNEAVTLTKEEMAALAPIIEEAAAADLLFANYVGQAADETERATEALAAAYEPSAALADKMGQLANQGEGVANIYAELPQYIKDANAAIEGSVGAFESMVGGMTGAKNAAGELLTPLQEINQAMGQLETKQSYEEAEADAQTFVDNTGGFARTLEEKMTGAYAAIGTASTEMGQTANSVFEELATGATAFGEATPLIDGFVEKIGGGNQEMATTVERFAEANEGVQRFGILVGETDFEPLKKGFGATGQKAGAAATKVEFLQQKIDALTDKTVTITVNQVGSVPDGAGGAASGSSNPGNPGSAGPGFQHGANFTVPPGFPNDTFPIRVSSGEEVQVTPAGQTTNNSSASINVTINTTGDPAAVATAARDSLMNAAREIGLGGFA